MEKSPPESGSPHLQTEGNSGGGGEWIVKAEGGKDKDSDLQIKER